MAFQFVERAGPHRCAGDADVRLDPGPSALGGNRTLAKTAAFDQVVTVALGSTLATAMLSKRTTLADGTLGFLMLVLLQFVLAWLILRSRAIERLVVQKPQVILRDGELRRETMRRVRLTESDVHAALRKAGVSRVEDALSSCWSRTARSAFCDGKRDGSRTPWPESRTAADAFQNLVALIAARCVLSFGSTLAA
ncbi:DUF421 domain-containing protein [bacterium]|nr:MAG: DUF421 domain-containing protein [bacterium]